MEYDLPAGAQRLTQSSDENKPFSSVLVGRRPMEVSEGIAGAIVTGEVRLEDNQDTHALPGRVPWNRLVRKA